MPKGKIDYSKGLIYKLCCKDPNVKEIYVGSTTNFRARKKIHKGCCCNPKNEQYNKHKYKFMRDNGGWNNWEMILIEYYSATDYLDLRKRERYWFDEMSVELNLRKPYISNEESKEQHRKSATLYNQKHKEKLKVKCKIYREKNQEKIKKKRKEIVVCECGCKITKANILAHRKTKKHIKLLNNICKMT